MKKKFNLVFVFTVVLSLLLLNTSGRVFAKKDPVVMQPGLADGSWSAGTEVEINLDAEKYPGLQLLTNGVKISKPAKLCHEFRGGDYGWVGEIRMLKNGVWVKQPTTTGWVPDTEGAYMACTEASAAGTYALFGWYDAKKARVSSLPECDSLMMAESGFMTSITSLTTTSFIFLIPDMIDTPVQLTIVKALDVNDDPINFDWSNFTVPDTTDGSGGFTPEFLVSETVPVYIHVILTTPTCYFDLDPLKHTF